MEIKQLARPLHKDQYYHTEYPKKRIILHHTAGSSVQSSVDWWNQNADHICTAFIIDRDGTVYQNFDPKYWAYALGVSGSTAIEQTSIQIELASWGAVKYNHDSQTWYPAASPKTKIPFEKVVACPFRGNQYYEKYPQEQVTSLVDLIDMLVKVFNIKIQYKLRGFWEYNHSYVPSSLPEGIWSHTTVRKDKTDIFPQPSLVQAIYDRFLNK